MFFFSLDVHRGIDHKVYINEIVRIRSDDAIMLSWLSSETISSSNTSLTAIIANYCYFRFYKYIVCVCSIGFGNPLTIETKVSHQSLTDTWALLSAIFDVYVIEISN